MRGMFLMMAASIGGGIGWWLGFMIDPMVAVVLASIGTGLGVYLWRRLERDL